MLRQLHFPSPFFSPLLSLHLLLHHLLCVLTLRPTHALLLSLKLGAPVLRDAERDGPRRGCQPPRRRCGRRRQGRCQGRRQGRGRGGELNMITTQRNMPRVSKMLLAARPRDLGGRDSGHLGRRDRVSSAGSTRCALMSHVCAGHWRIYHIFAHFHQTPGRSLARETHITAHRDSHADG